MTSDCIACNKSVQYIKFYLSYDLKFLILVLLLEFLNRNIYLKFCCESLHIFLSGKKFILKFDFLISQRNHRIRL